LPSYLSDKGDIFGNWTIIKTFEQKRCVRRR